MSMTLSETLIDRRVSCDELTGVDEGLIYDQILEVDSPKDSMAFIVIDSLMLLLVYLAPVVVFGYTVAPVVSRLLRMPISY